jgi:hypothetical protein
MIVKGSKAKAAGIILAAAFSVANVGATLAAAPPPSDEVEAVAQASLTAIVTKINHKTRLVTLKDEDGKEYTVHAGDQVRNLAHVKVGDKVEARYIESAVLDLQKPNSSTPTYRVDDAVGRATPGEKPGGFATTRITAIAEVTNVDPTKGTISFVGPMHNIHTVTVHSPDSSDILKRVKVGDYIRIAYTQAIAVAVEPRS